MMAEEYSQGVNDARPELHDQNSEYEEPYRAPQKNRQNEMADAHFGDRGPEGKDLERRRGRQHRRKHEAPEGMPLERRMQLLKSLWGNALAQQFLPTFIPNHVDH